MYFALLQTESFEQWQFNATLISHYSQKRPAHRRETSASMFCSVSTCCGSIAAFVSHDWSFYYPQETEGVPLSPVPLALSRVQMQVRCEGTSNDRDDETL